MQISSLCKECPRANKTNKTSMKKMSKNMDRQCTEQEVQLTPQLWKGCLVLFKIQVHIETAAPDHVSPVRLAVTQNVNATALARVGDEPSHITGGSVRSLKARAFGRKNSLLGVYPAGVFACVQTVLVQGCLPQLSFFFVNR